MFVVIACCYPKAELETLDKICDDMDKNCSLDECEIRFRE